MRVNGGAATVYTSASPAGPTLPCPFEAGSLFPAGCVSVAAPAALNFTAGDNFAFTAAGTDFATSAVGAPLSAAALSWGVTLFHDEHTHQILVAPGATASFAPPAVGEYDPVQSFGFTLTATSPGGATSTLFKRVFPVLGSVTLAPTAAAAASPLAAGMSVLINGSPVSLPTTFSTVAGMQIDLAVALSGSCAAWADGLGNRAFTVPRASLGAVLLLSCATPAAAANAYKPRQPQPQVSGSSATGAEVDTPLGTPAPAAAAPAVSPNSVPSPSPLPEPAPTRASGGASQQAQSATAVFLTLLAGAAALGAA
jgi:hypothetical protein